MFQLSVQEFENWKSQIVISNSERMSIRKAPLVFTTMRTMLSSQKYLILALERIQNKQVDHEEKISLILRYIRKIEESRQAEIDFSERQRIGYRQKGKE